MPFEWRIILPGEIANIIEEDKKDLPGDDNPIHDDDLPPYIGPTIDEDEPGDKIPTIIPPLIKIPTYKLPQHQPETPLDRPRVSYF